MNARRKTLPTRLEESNPTRREDRATDMTRTGRLKFAGEVVATLEVSAADPSNVDGAPVGMRFVSLYGKCDFAGDVWNIRTTIGVSPDNLAAGPVVYNYHDAPGRPKGYLLVTPDHSYWHLFTAGIRPELASARDYDAPLPKSWRAPLAGFLAGVAAEYLNAGSLWAESLRCSRWSAVEGAASSYNRAAEDLAGELDTYSARLAAARAADAYNVTTGEV